MEIKQDCKISGTLASGKTEVSYQQLWKDAYRDLFAIVLQEDIDSEPANISIELPNCLSMGNSMTVAVARLPVEGSPK